MIAETADLLLTTLRLRGAVDLADLRRRWTSVDLAGLPALTEYEGCVLWLYLRLKQLHILDGVPPAFAEWLSARAHRLAAHNLLVDAQRDALVQLLNELHVPHVLLKGAARRLLADVYPYADARGTSDVDVLVPHELARPTWERLLSAGFAVRRGRDQCYDSHFHLPPLTNGRAIAVELHTSTSHFVPAPLAWKRFEGSARVAPSRGGPTRLPAATELLWHAITHAPLPCPSAFRLRFLQDATVVWAAGAEVDWGEIAARLGSGELPDSTLARFWLGPAARLTGLSDTDSRLGALPHFDLSKALSWRLTVFRLLGAGGPQSAARSVWGPRPLSRGQRLLIDEATRAELSLPPAPPPPDGTTLRRAGRRLVATAARLAYRGWRAFRRA